MKHFSTEKHTRNTIQKLKIKTYCPDEMNKYYQVTDVECTVDQQRCMPISHKFNFLYPLSPNTDQHQISPHTGHKNFANDRQTLNCLKGAVNF